MDTSWQVAILRAKGFQGIEESVEGPFVGKTKFKFLLLMVWIYFI